jgi:hypothetical protein
MELGAPVLQGMAHRRNCMGREWRPWGSSLVVTWGGGLLPTMRKGGCGGQSASGMVLGARRIENGDEDQKQWRRRDHGAFYRPGDGEAKWRRRR